MQYSNGKFIYLVCLIASIVRSIAVGTRRDRDMVATELQFLSQHTRVDMINK